MKLKILGVLYAIYAFYLPLFYLSIASIRSNYLNSVGDIDLDIEAISITCLLAAFFILGSAGLPFK